MFAPTSRYANLPTSLECDRRGRQVAVVPVPPAPQQTLLGLHQRRQGQRVDHLAHHYLKDATAAWRIWELNEVMLPEALQEVPEIAIPR